MSTAAGTTEVTFEVDGTTLTTTPHRLVVAGYTGRDGAAVAAHVAELAAEGIAPPPRVPMLYELDPDLLTTATVVPVAGPATSGEVEPLLVRHARRWYLGVASDHTDRALERVDVARSKAACPKPVGRELVALPEGLAEGVWDTAWDRVAVTCHVDGEPYQDGGLAALRTPSNLLAVLDDGLVDDDPDDDLVVLGGTVPLLTDGFRHGGRWDLVLAVADRALSLTYHVVAPEET